MAALSLRKEGPAHDARGEERAGRGVRPPPVKLLGILRNGGVVRR